MPRFSANLGLLWPDRPLIERIDAAARAGFKAVELHWPYALPAALLRQRCTDNDVALLGINTPVGDGEKGDFGLAAQIGREREFRNTFEQAADYARSAGASSIHVMAGNVAPADKAASTAIFLENLSFAAQVAPDLNLLLEPMNRHDRPDYYYSTIGEAVDLIAKAGVPNLGVMFDAYHVGRNGDDVLFTLERHIAQIAHVQVAAVPSRAEPDEGAVAFREVFAALDALGYNGWVGCEYNPRAGTDQGLAWARSLGVTITC